MWKPSVNAICERAHGTGFTPRSSTIVAMPEFYRYKRSPTRIAFAIAVSAGFSSVTFDDASAGPTAIVSASDFACTRHGYPSHQVQRCRR